MTLHFAIVDFQPLFSLCGKCNIICGINATVSYNILHVHINILDKYVAETINSYNSLGYSKLNLVSDCAYVKGKCLSYIRNFRAYVKNACDQTGNTRYV